MTKTLSLIDTFEFEDTPVIIQNVVASALKYNGHITHTEIVAFYQFLEE